MRELHQPSSLQPISENEIKFGGVWGGGIGEISPDIFAYVGASIMIIWVLYGVVSYSLWDNKFRHTMVANRIGKDS